MSVSTSSKWVSNSSQCFLNIYFYINQISFSNTFQVPIQCVLSSTLLLGVSSVALTKTQRLWRYFGSQLNNSVTSHTQSSSLFLTINTVDQFVLPSFNLIMHSTTKLDELNLELNTILYLYGKLKSKIK